MYKSEAQSTEDTKGKTRGPPCSERLPLIQVWLRPVTSVQECEAFHQREDKKIKGLLIGSQKEESLRSTCEFLDSWKCIPNADFFLEVFSVICLECDFLVKSQCCRSVTFSGMIFYEEVQLKKRWLVLKVWPFYFSQSSYSVQQRPFFFFFLHQKDKTEQVPNHP